MKKMIALILALVLAMAMTACSLTELMPQTETATEPPATEAPTEQVYEGVLYPMVKNFADYEYGIHAATLELVNDELIRVTLYMDICYEAKFVEQIAVGDTITFLDREILIETIDYYGNDYDGYTYEINRNDPENHISLSDNMGTYYLYDSNWWRIPEAKATYDLTPSTPNFEFIDHRTTDPELVNVPQKFRALVKMLQENPDYFTVYNTCFSIPPTKYHYATVIVKSS